MTKIDTSGLQAVKSGRKAKEKPEWAPFDFELLHDGYYYACDQSLTATGLVRLYVMHQESGMHVEVQAVGKAGVEPEEDVSGWEDVLRRTEALEEHFSRWLHAADVGCFHNVGVPFYRVHEAPPIGGGSPFLKPELSLVTAYAFRRACSSLRYVDIHALPMVRPQDHKNLICGNANADKKVHHAALKKHFMPRIVGSEMITNEATRDALSIALTAAYRGSK